MAVLLSPGVPSMLYEESGVPERSDADASGYEDYAATQLGEREESLVL